MQIVDEFFSETVVFIKSNLFVAWNRLRPMWDVALRKQPPEEFKGEDIDLVIIQVIGSQYVCTN